MPMDVFHILLGRPWKFDKKVIHDGRSNCHSFEQNGIRHVLHPLQEGGTIGQSAPKFLMFPGKEYLQQIEKEDFNYDVVCKPRVVTINTNMKDIPKEIQEMLSEFSDIMVDDLPNELPPMRDISHQFDFIPGANLPNKAAYRLTPQEIEEVRRQVQGLLDK